MIRNFHALPALNILKYQRLLCCILCISLSSLVFSSEAWASTRIHSTVSAHTSLPDSFQLPDLDDDSSQWSTYEDGGTNSHTLSSVGTPSLDGQALSLSLLGGTPYTGIHAYRTLPQINANTFEMDVSFYLTSQENLQGLEFTINRWHANRRLEWAMQWEQFADGTIQQGLAPTWRVWTGQSWQNTGRTQPLALDTWHTFTLSGNIVRGQVHYLNFSCDEMSSPLGLVFPPTTSPGEKIVLGAQIDGNAQEAPVTVTLDHLDFFFSKGDR